MNILFVTHENCKKPSGVKTVIESLCREWEREDNIIILTNKRHGGFLLLEKELSDKVHIKHVPIILPSELLSSLQLKNNLYKVGVKLLFFIYPIFFILWLAIWMRVQGINLVINHNGGWPGGELNRWIVISGKLAMIKHNILVLHSMPINYRKVFKYLLIMRDKFISLCYTDLVTVSNACRDSIQKKTGFYNLAHVIYNGIYVPKLRERNISPSWNGDFPIIGFFGGIEFFKGAHVLIDSLKYIRTPCELVLIGNGNNEYINYLKDRSKYSKWKVHFLGFKDNALALYQWVDIVTLVSIEYESFGMTLLEGMLWNKPTVCSDFGGMKEIVDDEKSGLIVEADNPKELAKSLDRLLVNKELRETMGSNGRKKLEEYFNATLMARNYKLLISHE